MLSEQIGIQLAIPSRNFWGIGSLIFAAALTTTGCGPSLNRLNKLAANGSINEIAPVSAHLQIEIAAPPARVWNLLVNAFAWPTWQKQIDSVAGSGRLGPGENFTWKAGDATIHSQVQLFELGRRLGWTGTAFTAKAVHVWELVPEAGNQTVVRMKESMDGPAIARIYPSEKLARADREWLVSLKRAAERVP